MAIIFSVGTTGVSGNVEVTLSSVSNIPIPNDDQTLVQVSTSGNGATTVYTVPANKILYLQTFNVASAAGASWILYNGSGGALLSGNYTANGSNPQNALWGYTAGQNVVIYSSVSAVKEIIGVLMDA